MIIKKQLLKKLMSNKAISQRNFSLKLNFF